MNGPRGGIDHACRVKVVLSGLPSVVVVEQDGTIAEQLRNSGTPVVQGDGDEPSVLDRARIADARLLLVTATDPFASRRAIEHAHRVNATIEVVTRLHHDSQREMFNAFPRTQCVHGELELAYSMARIMLQGCGISTIETEAS